MVWWWLLECGERVVWVGEGDDEAVVRLASELKDNCWRPAMAHGEGGPVRFSESADQNDPRSPAPGMRRP